MKRLQLLWAIAALAFPCCRGSADILFGLNPTTITANPGDVIHFFGTVANLDLGSGIDLVQISSTIVPALDDVEDPTPFFTNFAGTLGAGATINNQEIFTLTVNPTATAGTYNGSFTIEDAGGNPLPGTSTQSFILSVTPEPAEYVLYGLGVVGLVAWKRRRRPMARTSQAV